MDIYNTYFMLAAVSELPPLRTFFKDRYFPTNTALDVFGTAKVLVDYREGDKKLAPFVVERMGGVSVMRGGYETFELEPPNISLSRTLTMDNLKKRNFGEALHSNMIPADRAAHYLLEDLEDLSRRITRREEWMAAQTILNNGCVMRHITDKEDVFEEVEARYYTGDDNPAIYTPPTPWSEGDKGWWADVAAMARMLTRRGMPAADLVIASDISEFILGDERVQRMLDNRRYEMGEIAPQTLPNGVVRLGRLIFSGVALEILVADESYEDESGQDTPYWPNGTVAVTAPGCGHTLYGAHSQIEDDEELHTHAGARIPQYIVTKKPPAKEVTVTSRPLMAPRRKNPWVVARDVFN